MKNYNVQAKFQSTIAEDPIAKVRLNYYLFAVLKLDSLIVNVATLKLWHFGRFGNALVWHVVEQ